MSHTERWTVRKGKKQKTTHQAKERGRVLGRSFPEAQRVLCCPTSDLQPTEGVALVVMWNLKQDPDVIHQLPVSTLYSRVQTPRGHHTETESQPSGSCPAPWTASTVVCERACPLQLPRRGGRFGKPGPALPAPLAPFPLGGGCLGGGQCSVSWSSCLCGLWSGCHTQKS